MTKDRCYLLIIGGPGCGKGTQCARVVEQFEGWKHLPIGKLFRQHVIDGTAIVASTFRTITNQPTTFMQGRLCEAFLNNGTVVPIDVVIELIKEEIGKTDEKKILVDGFPRKVEQIAAFEEEIGPIMSAIFYDCPNDVLRQRLLERRATSDRADDGAEIIEKRLKTFNEVTVPVRASLESMNKLKVIVSTGPVDEIFAQTAEHVRDIEATWVPPEPSQSQCCIC